MTETKTRTRRTFASEYELRAVQLVTEKGFSYAEAARQLGLRDTQTAVGRSSSTPRGLRPSRAKATGARSARKSIVCGPRTSDCCRSVIS